jgi:hypothetical protein
MLSNHELLHDYNEGTVMVGMNKVNEAIEERTYG